MGGAVLVHEIDEERRRVRLPWRKAQRRPVDGGVRIGIARVPASDLRVIVEDVADIPAENDIAEAEALVDHVPELLERNELAPQDPVDVEPSDLDLLDLVP